MRRCEHSVASVATGSDRRCLVTFGDAGAKRTIEQAEGGLESTTELVRTHPVVSSLRAEVRPSVSVLDYFSGGR